MELQKMSIVELKALAYDNLAQIENFQKNLGAINQEISRRINAPIENKDAEKK